MSTYPSSLTLKHLALRVTNLAACEHFYVTVLGMRVIWRPDPDNVYLSNGQDNLALHQVTTPLLSGDHKQALDHLGFVLEQPQDLAAWSTHLVTHQVPIRAPIKHHRDGSSSLYCADPEGNIIQIIYLPTITSGL